MQTMAITPWRQQRLWVQRGSKSPNSLFRENSLYTRVFFFRDSVLNHSPKLCMNMKINSAVTIHVTFMRVCLHYIVNFSIVLFPTIGILANVLLHAIELSGQNFKNMQINQLQKSENQSFYIHGTVLEPWFRDTIIFWAALIEAFAWTIENPVVLVWCYAQICEVIFLLLFVFVWCYAQV